MFFRRLIFACGLALMLAFAAQPAPARVRNGAGRGQPRAQGLSRRPQARRPMARPNKPGQRRPPMRDGQAFAGNRNRPAGGAAARPPNPDLFKPNPNVVRQLPPGAMERLHDMSPQQQERFLDNNQRFGSLPPEKQAQIRRNLQRWNTLSPAEKDRLSHAERNWERFSPNQRQMVQNQILPKWQQMSPDRRQLVIGRLHTLQGMTPAQRGAALNDPRFMQGLTPDEQSVLRNLNSLQGRPNPQ